MVAPVIFGVPITAAVATLFAALFTSTGGIIVAALAVIGILFRIPQLAILAAIILLMMINSVIGLPFWFILIVIIILAYWLLKGKK